MGICTKLAYYEKYYADFILYSLFCIPILIKQIFTRFVYFYQKFLRLQDPDRNLWEVRNKFWSGKFKEHASETLMKLEKEPRFFLGDLAHVFFFPNMRDSLTLQ